jgi:hypothetical protein
VIWFDASYSNRYTVDELAAIADFTVVAELDDGTIYEVRRRK